MAGLLAPKHWLAVHHVDELKAEENREPGEVVDSW